MTTEQATTPQIEAAALLAQPAETIRATALQQLDAFDRHLRDLRAVGGGAPSSPGGRQYAEQLAAGRAFIDQADRLTASEAESDRVVRRRLYARAFFVARDADRLLEQDLHAIGRLRFLTADFLMQLPATPSAGPATPPEQGAHCARRPDVRTLDAANVQGYLEGLHDQAEAESGIEYVRAPDPEYGPKPSELALQRAYDAGYLDALAGLPARFPEVLEAQRGAWEAFAKDKFCREG